jgi:anti-anti-sigma factor
MPSRFIQVSQTDGVNVIALGLPRTVDLYEFDRINEDIAKATEADPSGRWVLDATGSEYVGSAILGVLVNLRQRLRNGGGGRLVLCGLSDQLANALRTCSLFSLFTIAHTRPDALKQVKTLR